MTAQPVTHDARADDDLAQPDDVLDPRDPVADATAHIAAHALTPSSTRRVGLELELHLVDLADPARRPGWARVQRSRGRRCPRCRAAAR